MFFNNVVTQQGRQLLRLALLAHLSVFVPMGLLMFMISSVENHPVLVSSKLEHFLMKKNWFIVLILVLF